MKNNILLAKENQKEQTKMNEMPSVTPPVSLQVGDEPAKFLTESNCKSISTEEKIKGLDSDDDKQIADQLKYLNVTKPLANDSNSDNTNSMTEARSLSMPVLHEATVFSILQSYMYFDSLTTANIAKYQIINQAVGSSYQEALIYANGEPCKIYGPLLENLFPDSTDELLVLLKDVGEFIYDCRTNFELQSDEDLRKRVLHVYMRSAPSAFIHLKFDNETRESAKCSTIDERRSAMEKRKASSDIKPTRHELMQKIKEELQKASM